LSISTANELRIAKNLSSIEISLDALIGGGVKRVNFPKDSRKYAVFPWGTSAALFTPPSTT
jgi:hypothetical protein